MRIGRVAAELGEGLAEVLWPTRCVGCDQPGELICSECRAALPWIEQRLACPSCGAPFGYLTCTECDGLWPTRAAIAALGFHGTPARMVTCLKDGHELRLAPVIAAALLTALEEASAWPARDGLPRFSPAATDGGADGTPGRLQFVDGGGLIGVFAGSARWSLPVQADTAAVSEEGELLEIGAAAGVSVSASAGGEVRAIGEDPALGPYVRIHHGEDLESIYYHLSDIRVEEGQPLLLGDTLGTVPEDGKLYLRVLKTGAPQQIDRYMSVPEGD